MVSQISDSPVGISMEGKYQIGAVCNRTGLSHHVLRVWEKRYGVVTPKRQSNRRRLYSEDDVVKLSLLKALVDRGHSIGSIAGLSGDELESRYAVSGPNVASVDTDYSPTVLFVGETLALGRSLISPKNFYTVNGEYAGLDQAILDSNGLSSDFAVIEFPSLLPHSLVELNAALRRLDVKHMIVLYEYASQDTLSRVASSRITAIQGGLTGSALEAILQSLIGKSSAAVGNGNINGRVGRRYSNASLAKVTRLPSTVKCECPQHLARLIVALAQFESYSDDCESLNKDDAELHRNLANITAHARSSMEDALSAVLEFEGLTDNIQEDGFDNA